MRWRYSREGDSMQTCLWCFHVKTGTFLLGVISLILQVAALALISVAVLHPDAVPVWISTFVAPPGNQNAIRMHENSMNSDESSKVSRVEKNAIMEENGMPMIGPNIDPILTGSRMMDARRKIMEEVMGGGKEMEMFRGEDSRELIRHGNMRKDGKDSKMKMRELTQKVGDDNLMVGSSNDSKLMDEDNENSFGSSEPSDPSDSLFLFKDPSFPGSSARRPMDLHEDNKFVLFVMLMGCIGASFMMVLGVIKSQPGYLMPYMGIQVFDFCVSSLTVFTFFSYAPNVKPWIAAQPDSFPMKSVLIAMDADRLLLAFILVSVLILVVKAYLMAVVWACYKYLTHHQNEVRGIRRSTEEDTHNPEDSELLLPPKYEDIVDTRDDSQSRSESTPPPPYHLG